jgi:tetratricopeptide (TPR) repeat protein
VTFEEAQALQLSGQYSDVLRGAVREQVKAREEGRAEDELRWTLWAAKACRYVGRIYEGVAHAAHAAMRAHAAGRADLLAEALYVQALNLKADRRLAEATETLDRAIATLPEGTSDFTRAVFELDRAELALDAGRPEEAAAALNHGAARVHLLENTRLLAWTLYLRAQIEKAATAAGLLAGAHSIAQSIDCPELQWQILWRLAERMRQVWDFEAEDDCARKAMKILQRMAEPLSIEDRQAFWRSGARSRFFEYVRLRFGTSFEEGIPPAGEAPRDPTQMPWWDPALMPQFVQESLKAGQRR